MGRLVGQLIALYIVASTGLAVAALSQGGTAPADLTAEQDHQRALAMLRIDSIRRGVNARDPDAPNAANWG